MDGIFRAKSQSVRFGGKEVPKIGKKEVDSPVLK